MRLAWLIAIASLIAASARGADLWGPNEQVPPAAGSSTAASATYRLEAGDTIEVRFLSNPELNELGQIRPDGRFSMQIVGELHLSGLTVAEAMALVTTVYKDTLKQPSVTVQVRTFANRRVFVAGEVARPGVLALVGDQTAMGAITEAGGLKSSAKRNAIVVIRRGANDAPEQFQVSMRGRSTDAPQAAAFRLQPMDVVVVMESGIARADRAVDQYVRQLVPVLLTGGFTYLFNGGVLGVK
jgi:protein involved in polysaccharide export with SLBB domain